MPLTVTLAAQLSVAVSGRYRLADTTWGEAAKVLNKTVLEALTHGVDEYQSNRLYSTSGTISSGSFVDVDLGLGSLEDIYGQTIALEELTLLIVTNKNTTASQTLVVGGAAVAPLSSLFADASDKAVIGPDGLLLLWSPKDGYIVDAGHYNLRLATGGAYTVAYELLAIGRQTP